MKAGLKFALIASAAALALVGCGGDSGTVPAPTSGSTSGGSTAGGGTTGQTTTVTAADKYVGTWVGACESSQGYDSSGKNLKGIQTVTLTKVDASNLTGTKKTAFYSPTDCSGAPVLTVDGFTVTVKINSSTTFLGKAADLVTLTDKGPGGLSAQTNVIVNGVKLPGNYYTYSGSIDRYVNVENNSWSYANVGATSWDLNRATKQ